MCASCPAALSTQGPIPAIFGMVMASMCLNDLGGLDVLPEPPWSVADDELAMLLRRLTEREELMYGTASGVQVRRDKGKKKKKRKKSWKTEK